MAIANWSTTAALNVESTGISGTGGGVGIQGTNLPSNFDNALRDIMAQVATFVTAGAFTGTTFTLTSTDAGAAAGPVLTFYRNSATPAAADIAGKILFQGEDSAGNTEDYAEIYQVIDDTTSGSEDASLLFRTKIAGSMTTQFTVSAAGMTMNQSLVLKAGTAPTAEGAMEWNSTTNAILVGDAATTKTFRANSWETISETALSAVASHTATGLSAYRAIRISGWIRPVTDAVNVRLLTSTNNGSSYDSSAGNYQQQYSGAKGVAGIAATASVASFFLNSNSGVGNVAPEGIHFNVTLMDFNKTEYCYINADSVYLDGGSLIVNEAAKGFRNSTTARDALQLICSSGNIALGYVVIEGIRG